MHSGRTNKKKINTGYNITNEQSSVDFKIGDLNMKIVVAKKS